MTSSARRLTGGLLAALLVGGCGGGSGRTPLSMTQMRQALDRVPIPAGATLYANYEQPRNHTLAGAISRYYHYSGARPLCRTLLEAAARAGFRVRSTGGASVSPGTCRTDPAVPTLGPQAGLVDLRPAHGGTTVRLGWAASEGIQLTVSDTAG